MKEAYFTQSTIDDKGNEFLSKVKGRMNIQNYQFDIGSSTLLVLDMQNYFLSSSSHAFIPSAPAIVNNIKQLMTQFISRNRPIIITRHINTNDNANQMSKWWKNLIKEESESSLIIDEINEIVNDKSLNFNNNSINVIKKSQYDAFYKSNLEEILQKGGISQVVVCGVMTHLCCETTARSAFIRGFEVFFTIDGTATYNENYHIATLTNLAHGFAIPILTKNLLIDHPYTQYSGY